MQLRNIAIPYLIKLNQQVNESVVLASGDGRGDILTQTFYDSSHPNQSLKVIPDEGISMNLHSNAPGKVLLADFSDEELQGYFNSNKIERCTPNTITDISAMKRHLITIRQEGFAFDDEEESPGVRGIAAELRDDEGKIVGALGVVVPSIRLNRAKMRKLAPIVKSYAMQISKDLGFQN
jgi:DNA-binding IclR family transcriptional regulator